MSPVIVTKSDQISSDDFLSGPRTYSIVSVEINPGTEQPVQIKLAGENRVWRPCKSMARCLVAAWGPDAKLYSGKSVTLYRDPKVKWGGLEVGGVRISHMSHIERPLSMALTATKGRRADYTVKPLILQVSPPPPQEPAALTPKEAAEMIRKAGNVAELRAVFGEVYKHFPAYDDATRDALTDLKDAVKLELTEAV
ncbi:MAG: hypothetical protein ACK5X3_20845 [Pseudomonadota bacterium]